MTGPARGGAAPNAPPGPAADPAHRVEAHLTHLLGELGQLEPGDVAGLRRLARRWPMDPTLHPAVTVLPAVGCPVPAYWLVPAGARGGPRIVYLHGGSFMAGDLAMYGHLASHVAARAGAALLFVDYRLAPDVRFPVPLHDALSAHAWALTHGPDAATPAEVALVGDSCGGGLALAAALAARDRGVPAAAVVVLSPITDLAVTGASVTANAAVDPSLTAEMLHAASAAYLDRHDPFDPLASPLFGDLRGLPPVLCQASERELVRDDSVRFVARARAAGVDARLQLWPGMVHCWHHFAGVLPEADAALVAVGEFLASVGGRPAR